MRKIYQNNYYSLFVRFFFNVKSQNFSHLLFEYGTNIEVDQSIQMSNRWM